MKLKFVGKMQKKKKKFNTIAGIANKILITSAVITGKISTSAFASGVGLPVGIVLSVTGLASTLGTSIT